MNFEKSSINSSQKARIEQLNNVRLSYEIKSITVQLTILLYFSKIDKNLSEIPKI